MDKIGLVAAMPSESNALLRYVRNWKRTKVGVLRGVGFQSTNRDCVLVTSGMGIRRAAEAARGLIEAFHPACLVSFGIAGAFREDLMIGDVIMATLNCSLEKGELSPFQPIAVLSGDAQEVVEQALLSYNARFMPGTAVTTRGSQLILQHPLESLNPIIEMETAGILQAAVESGTPVIVLRSVSDGPLAPIPFNLEAITDDDNNLRLGTLLLSILKNPQVLRQSWQMVKNSRIAANNAAIAVAALLSQSFPFTV